MTDVVEVVELLEDAVRKKERKGGREEGVPSKDESKVLRTTLNFVLSKGMMRLTAIDWIWLRFT